MPPALDRREFLQATSAAAVIGLIGRNAAAINGPRADPDALRVAVLREAGFPAVDAPPPAPDVLAAALDGFEVSYLSAADLDARLTPGQCDVFVSPYGSAFPREGWDALKRYLDAAGHWVNLGGVPCAVPVERNGGGWQVADRDGARPKQLGIVLACAVDAALVRQWRPDPDLPWTSPLAAGSPRSVWEPYWRFSSVPEIPDEGGSPGPTEAVVRPLVSGLDEAGRSVAVPYVLVDRLEREFAGGRWLFATHDGPVPGPALRALVVAAARRVWRLDVRPSYACYREGERPHVAVTCRGFPSGSPVQLSATCRLEVSDGSGARLAALDVEVRGTDAEATAAADLGPHLPAALEPGLYRLDATLQLPEPDGAGEARHTTGFRVWDERLLAAGAPAGAGVFALTAGGAPLVATGTTYMASDVHRKFLLQPNPWLWDRDFDALRRAGVNLVRTGIWSGWKQLMPRPGAFDEAALRALDAWLLTARRHGIPVVFTCFAFLPESWGGENPYLDPASVEAQRAFVTALARRYRGMRDLVWDLINEPSFCNKDHLWSCRPNYDRFERAAWAAWLRGRGVPGADLPPLEAFADGGPENPLVVEYRLFAQAMFARWVGEMRAALRSAGAGRQLVTVGQDEAGTRDSPNNLFLAPALDFTCIHTWWLNDAVVWDEVLTRAPGRANLVEETGVMFSAHPPGVEERWEAYARDLLERKMAIALGPGGAGFIEWVWNSNCYMPSDNEAAIGLLRADGSAKPELEALRGMAAFVAEARPYLVGREEEPVLMLVPHTNMFSTRNTATDATKRAVRAMQYGCRVGLAAVSEFAATAEQRVPRLVIVPSPGVLRPEAWAALRAWARRGSLVLVTGSLARLARYGSRPAVGPSGAIRIAMGKGAVLWAPAAVELAGDDGPATALYGWALAQAGVVPAFTVEGADASVLVHAAAYRDALLLTLVGGTEDAAVRVTPRESRAVLTAAVPAGRAALLLLGRRDGRVLARYAPV
jgi:Cellulase (glycosyl hydrolase family 5)